VLDKFFTVLEELEEPLKNLKKDIGLTKTEWERLGQLE